MPRNPLGDLGNNLGEYLREQRTSAKLSVRQLSAVTGISNTYLSQIERGIKKPSAEILQGIAKGLSISAETLYVQAGLLDPDETAPRVTARELLRVDPRLTSRQRQTLIDIYDSFVGAESVVPGVGDPLDHDAPGTPEVDPPAPRAVTKRAATKRVGKRAATKKAAPKKTAKKTVVKRAVATKAATKATKKTTAKKTSTRRRTPPTTSTENP